ncbi:hypothetical protein [Falsibacillus albus]|uniref:Uncharacterized protein n=1 Tax=Falsibacillus albus TaxID=2478915 RepID=A0A3L7JWA9_9BACI|nr:hypothetical protein [Falsibacillus albus]RLQ94605.1 hypothetical protein D9X91_13800 [Falsibacillus albus]
MEALLELLFEFLLDALMGLGQMVLSYSKDVTEMEIEKNIAYFKTYDWFQDYLKDSRFEKLINENSKVRFEIGKFNRKKFKNNRYVNVYQKRITNVLMKEVR